MNKHTLGTSILVQFKEFGQSLTNLWGCINIHRVMNRINWLTKVILNHVTEAI